MFCDASIDHVMIDPNRTVGLLRLLLPRHLHLELDDLADGERHEAGVGVEARVVHEDVGLQIVAPDEAPASLPLHALAAQSQGTVGGVVRLARPLLQPLLRLVRRPLAAASAAAAADRAAEHAAALALAAAFPSTDNAPPRPFGAPSIAELASKAAEQRSAVSAVAFATAARVAAATEATTSCVAHRADRGDYRSI